MTLRAFILATAAAILPGTTSAMTLEFPVNSIRAAEELAALGSYDLPLGSWQNGEITAETTEGAVLQQVWRIPATDLTTLQLLAPLREQLEAAGFEIAFECADTACGGFDFRYQIDVAPEPIMHVDLGDYRFLSARKPDSDEVLSLLVSRTSETGFVQVMHVGPADAASPNLTTSTKTQPATQTDTGAPRSTAPLGQALERDGHVVLADLSFDTGSSTLGEGRYASLAALAEYLTANPTRTIALVGHTDAEGSLAGNVALSKRRATSVMQRLIDTYGVARTQLSAEGMGFLAPRASNLTDEGRDSNRRVEAIMLSTE